MRQPAIPATAAPGGRADATESSESRVMTEFCRHYGLTFRDRSLLKLALTHRSYLHVTGQRDSNERLEFLGDSVLGLVTSDNLYRAHPTEHEGQLTKTKSLLVSKAILSRRALAMGLGRFVLMSHSEVESGGRQRLSILADAFEAVVGAIYLDQGFETARTFIERWLLRDTGAIVADKRHANYKSHLQEYVQSTYRSHPVYRIRSEMGPDHSKQFMVEVLVGRRTLGEGRGPNKKEAEQAAARDALERVERGPTSDRTMKTDTRSDTRGHGPGAVEGRERVEAVTERVRAPRPGRSASRHESEADPTPEPEDDAAGDERAEGVSLSGPGSADREVLSTRRRRGRRGGRGRRRSPEDRSPIESGSPEPVAESEAPSVPRSREVPAPVRTREAPSPARPVHAPAPPAPARPVAAFVPPEVEPLPPAFEEDENEEVGRPEGPIDLETEVRSWAAPVRAVERAPMVEPEPAPAAVAEPLAEPRADHAPGRSALDERPEREEAAEPEEQVQGPAVPSTSPAPPAAPGGVSYGRRSGRSVRR